MKPQVVGSVVVRKHAYAVETGVCYAANASDRSTCPALWVTTQIQLKLYIDTTPLCFLHAIRRFPELSLSQNLLYDFPLFLSPKTGTTVYHRDVRIVTLTLLKNRFTRSPLFHATLTLSLLYFFVNQFIKNRLTWINCYILKTLFIHWKINLSILILNINFFLLNKNNGEDLRFKL